MSSPSEQPTEDKPKRKPPADGHREPPHRDLVDPERIDFVGRLRPHQHWAFAQLATYYESLGDTASLKTLQRWFGISPAVDGRRSEQLTEVLKKASEPEERVNRPAKGSLFGRRRSRGEDDG